MSRSLFTAIPLLLLLLLCCDPATPETPLPDPHETEEENIPEQTRELSLSSVVPMPGLPVGDGMSSLRSYWAEGAEISFITDSKTRSVIPVELSAGGRTGHISGTLKHVADEFFLRAVYPYAEMLSVPSLQHPLAASPDPSCDYMVLLPRKMKASATSPVSIPNPQLRRIVSFAGFNFGASLSAYAGDVIRYVQIWAEDAISGDFSLSGLDSYNTVDDLRVEAASGTARNRCITLDCRELALPLSGARIWAALFEGIHQFSRIIVTTDRSVLTFAGRRIACNRGSGSLVTLELESGDSASPYDPEVPSDGTVRYFKGRTLAGQAFGENFYCPLNGHSYSPYSLRFLDPFTYSSSNPNGWSFSSANKPGSGSPLLSDAEYRSVKPYILFFPPGNYIYGPASKNTAMMMYSFDAMLFVNQLGTPALNFRRLESSGAASEEATVAGWVRKAEIQSIATAPDGTVTVRTASSSVSRNFKVDKTSLQYSASGTGRDVWREGDVIMVQHLGRYGNVDDKEYLSSGFIHILAINSDGYNSSTRDFVTMDSYASLTIDSYWEK